MILKNEIKMSKCPFGKEEEINTYLEGYDPLQGEWKSVNGEIKYKKDCEKCPNFKNCEEW